MCFIVLFSDFDDETTVSTGKYLYAEKISVEELVDTKYNIIL